jgi:uncharacterized protein YdeI (BOF family)
MKKYLSILLVSAFVLVFSFATNTHAESSSSNAAQGLEISPAIVELNAEKGKTYRVNIKVTNVTGGDIAYKTSDNDFQARDETGSPQVLIDSNAPESSSVVGWISSTSNFFLKAHETTTINAIITVPSNAEPGGHYGVLRFFGQGPSFDSTGVGLSASAGSLILIRVDGQINESSKLASFFTANGDKQSSIFEHNPINIVTRITNDGNIHVKPVGTIQLKNMFGNIVGSIPVNNAKANVLPDSTRKFEVSYNDWMFGYYTADLTMGYGTNGQTILASTSFWVIPYKAIAIIVVILLTVLYVVVKSIKKYNKYIIEKSKNESNKKKH